MKSDNRIRVVGYDRKIHGDLVRLLIELQSEYPREKISSNIRDLQEGKNLKQACESYVDFLEKNQIGDWITLLARTDSGKVPGFIIRSIETDDQLVLSPIAKVKDWFVEEEFRGKGVGGMLYDELEEWFREKGCRQVRSDTWFGNELSIDVHRKMGFFMSGVQFAKKL